MSIRSSRSVVTFSRPFTLSGYADQLPAGDYEVLVEEELLQGVSFAAYRRTGTYLAVQGKGSHSGRSELRPITEDDLVMAQRKDVDIEGPEVASSRPEDLK